MAPPEQLDLLHLPPGPQKRLRKAIHHGVVSYREPNFALQVRYYSWPKGELLPTL